MSGLLQMTCYKMYLHAVKLLKCHLGFSVYPAIFLALKKKAVAGTFVASSSLSLI